MAKQKNRTMTLSISRYSPELDEKPHLEKYDVNLADIKGQMLLDVLLHVKEKNPDLGFRFSCSEGVCGSDGMNINGVNGLACVTRIDELPNKVTIRPLPGLPIIRDLIVDMNQFYDQLHKVNPYLKCKSAAPVGKERKQTQEERSHIDGLYECILCACCTTSCPSFWWNPDKFLGPAALLAACRFVKDSRDDAKAERLDELRGAFAAFRCRVIMNCVRVCPKGLNPTKAIADLHEEIMLTDTEDSD